MLVTRRLCNVHSAYLPHRFPLHAMLGCRQPGESSLYASRKNSATLHAEARVLLTAPFWWPKVWIAPGGRLACQASHTRDLSGGYNQGPALPQARNVCAAFSFNALASCLRNRMHLPTAGLVPRIIGTASCDAVGDLRSSQQLENGLGPRLR